MTVGVVEQLVKSGLGATGTTWRGVLQHVLCHLPVLLLLENVFGLTGKKLSDVSTCPSPMPHILNDNQPLL